MSVAGKPGEKCTSYKSKLSVQSGFRARLVCLSCHGEDLQSVNQQNRQPSTILCLRPEPMHERLSVSIVPAKQSPQLQIEFSEPLQILGNLQGRLRAPPA